MPTYEFRCKACGSTFEVKRPMSASSDPASCPDGHADTVKLLSVVGVGSNVAEPQGGGGCCGGGCCG
ncbi:zinc ribbon domain-containing protein [Umezawaea sp. NPDC059074]|uniref:FmdB family zinc ribbon protein n=1 Tax=Umezawaea sp. NPDC059074 TaxID=3346716 RepID=UPI00367B8DCC